jgi:energy-coupling factor transporter ATP-binding protein EcfA2
VNLIIGGNGTGKTSLLKTMYAICNILNGSFTQKSRLDEIVYLSSFENYFQVGNYYGPVTVDLYGESRYLPQEKRCLVTFDGYEFGFRYPDVTSMSAREVAEAPCTWGYHVLAPDKTFVLNRPDIKSVYIPTDDMLSHSPGLLALDRDHQIPFDKPQVDILAKAQYPETREIKPNAKKLLTKIKSVIGGEVVYENDSFYVVNERLGKIQFNLEASGYRKFGLLWKLLRNGLLESKTTLFWDEPENSLNPELVPELVDILIELSRNGVQIFIATHSDFLCKWFELKTSGTDDPEIEFFSLYRENDGISSESSRSYRTLTHNAIIEQSVKLYNEHLRRATGRDED